MRRQAFRFGSRVQILETPLRNALGLAITVSLTPVFATKQFETHPSWGATTFLPQPRAAVLLKAAPRVCLAPVQRSSRRVPFVRKRGIAGVQAQPPGLRPNPTFSLANSPVSPVDRSRLLRAPSNAASQDRGSSNLALSSSAVEGTARHFMGGPGAP